MRPIVFLFALLFFLRTAPAADALPSAATRPSLWSSLQADGRQSFTDCQRLIDSPLHSKAGQWGLAVGALGAIALSSLGDQPLREYAQSHRTAGSQQLLTPFSYYGTGFVLAPLIGGMYVGGLAFSQPWLHETGRCALTAVLLASLSTTLLKMTFGRQRPYLNEGHTDFDWFQLRSSAWSFPSGHTTAAFAMSTVLACRIDHPAATVALYSIAALTAAQRIHDDNHWLSDVLLGAAIGTCVGWGVAHRWNFDKKESAGNHSPAGHRYVALNSNLMGVHGQF
jgi:membrane-associated phospholipid phosphatase